MRNFTTSFWTRLEETAVQIFTTKARRIIAAEFADPETAAQCAQAAKGGPLSTMFHDAPDCQTIVVDRVIHFIWADE